MTQRRREYSGFWWDPAKPDDKWAGTLRLGRKGRARLTLIVPSPSFQALMTLREYPLLHGRTESGEPVSVLNTFEQRHGRFFVNAAIVGFHAETRDPVISRAVVVVRDLDVWWGRTAVEFQEPEKWPASGSVRYVRPEPVVVFDDGDFTVSISSAAGVTPSDMSYTVAEEIRFEFETKSPRPFSEVHKRIHACRDLLSVACLSLCNIQELRLMPPLDDDAKRRFRGATYHASPIFRERKSDRSRSWPDLLFRRSDVDADRLKTVFTTWLDRADSLQVVRSLYHAGSYGKGFLEFRFLSLAQAAEAYHQREFPERTYLTTSDYAARVLTPLRAALPADLSPRLRESIDSALAFGNQIKFKERLEDLFAAHHAALSSVVPVPTDWIKKVKDYRNTFTHHSPRRDAEPFDDEDVLRCLFILRMLLEMCFLRSMGFTSDEMETFAKRSYRYQQIKERFFPEGRNQPTAATSA